MVLRQGLTLAVTGLAIGLVASFAAESAVNAVFSSTGRDPLAYLLVGARTAGGYAAGRMDTRSPRFADRPNARAAL